MSVSTYLTGSEQYKYCIKPYFMHDFVWEWKCICCYFFSLFGFQCIHGDNNVLTDCSGRTIPSQQYASFSIQDLHINTRSYRYKYAITQSWTHPVPSFRGHACLLCVNRWACEQSWASKAVHAPMGENIMALSPNNLLIVVYSCFSVEQKGDMSVVSAFHSRFFTDCKIVFQLLSTF